MKKIFQLLVLVSMGLVMNSCYYDAFPEEEIIDPGTGGGAVEEVSYSADIVPIWAQCVGCHSGNTPPNMQDNSYANLLNGYVVANDADASVLYKSLLGTGGVSLMPPGSKWSQSKIDLVKNWINQGAKDN
ncbi:MAG: hypothetical protein COB01_00435 [Lutibacter sp.]|nr:MAG: hypothetical protein COB01_00435 [Lutibacter sp.]